MILGVGIDLVEVGRIRDSLERLGERAAKEAVSKAFGTGIGTEVGWLDIEVLRLASGSTQVHLHGAVAQLMEHRSAKSIHLNLTHTAQYASAVAILEG
ncbi:MAG: holo-ACP synthase [Verrucomicrobia bacterium]|nr:holo-ACP synthase [Verrucomicrobiota bacterium]